MAPSTCAECGFDPTEWDRQDSTRTLVHGDDLVELWSHGASGAVGEGVAASAAATRVDIARRDDRVEQVHALWHGLVSIDRLRREAGDTVPRQHGVVTQLSRSGGGVPKLAVHAVAVDGRGVVGDVQQTRVHHGRPWQALCLWSADVIDALVAEGHPIHPGAAGENITIRGLDWSTMRAGATIDIGSVRCQLSAPATPCRKNRRWFRSGQIDRMDHDRHPGSSRWYASVVRPGTIATDDPVEVEPTV